MQARFALKAATDEVHRELDDRLSRLDLAREADYRRFLHIHARAVPPVEGALAQSGIGNLVEDWDEGRRSSAIESDLAGLGEEMPDATQAPTIDGTAEMLGTAYVLEGSRLGGRVLKRRVGHGLPVEFLSRSSNLGSWTSLIAVMDRSLYSDALLGDAQRAARRCFALFLKVTREAGV